MKQTKLDLVELENKLRKLNLTEVQKQQLKDIGDILARKLELSYLTVRGFNNFAVLEWQKNISMTVAETESKLDTSPEERIKMFKEVMGIFSKKIEKYLVRKDKLHLLPKAIEAAIELYTNNYANRPPDVA